MNWREETPYEQMNASLFFFRLLHTDAISGSISVVRFYKSTEERVRLAYNQQRLTAVGPISDLNERMTETAARILYYLTSHHLCVWSGHDKNDVEKKVRRI